MSEYCKNCKELADENAELTAQLKDANRAASEWQNEALQSRASMELMEKGLDERDDLKELVARKEGAIELWKEENATIKAKLAQVHKDLGCELLDPNGTIWEHAAKVQKENDELKRQLAEGPVCGTCGHKRVRAFLERQIKEGELVPAEYVMDWGSESDQDDMNLDGLIQYAASRQKEGGE